MERRGDILRRREMWENTSFGQTDGVEGNSRPSSVTPLEGAGRVCPVCHGFGFVYPTLPAEHPDFGKSAPCSCVEEELEDQKEARLQRYSNLGSLVQWTFDSLVPQGRSGDPTNQEQFQRAVAAAREYAQAPQGWFVLTGSSGSGKTHLAAAIANELIHLGRLALFMVVPDLLDHLRATFAPEKAETYDDLFEQVRNAPVLILDDLGTQSSTPWAQEKLFQLLNHRYSAQLPTVVTISGSLDVLDERWRTRLCDPALSQVWALERRVDAIVQYQGALSLEMLSQMTFQRFDTGGLTATPDQQRSLRVAHETALRFAESPDGWLLFMGEVGCGKTHLAAAIANYRLQKGHAVFFVVVADLLDHLRSTFAPDSHVAYDVLFDSIRNTDLLILDDLGTHATSPWAEEKLFQLLNYRYNGRLPTVITTSLSPKRMHELSPAVTSRLGDTLVCKQITIDAPDYRGSQRPKEQDQQTGARYRRGRR